MLTTAAVGAAAGGAAAGSVAGFLVLAGTIGYESLIRSKQEKNLTTKISTLSQGQDRLTREVARTRNEVDLLKDDLARTAKSLQEQARIISEPASPAAARAANVPQTKAMLRKAQDSFSRMGNRTRATAITAPKAINDLKFMAVAKQIEAEDADSIDTTAAPPKFSPTIITELLHHAVEHDRIETFAQPIVRLPSRKLAYLELFARIRARAGVYLPADQYRELAEKETLLSEVDHLLLLHALDSIRADARRDAEIGYFLNISARTLKDVGFMSDLLEFIKAQRDLADRLIFELRQDEFMSLSSPLQEVMKGLARLGCCFSIDHVENPQADFARFEQMNVRFIKIDAARLVALGDSREGLDMIERIKGRLDDAGIILIAERMETERDLRELLDFDLDYGEGYLFGKPDLEIAYRPRKAA